MTDALHVLVDRSDLTNTRIDRTPTLEPAMGDVLVRVNRVAITANNVTYAVVSDRIPYFEFFPAPEGWGRVPVWGFGDVIASNAPGIEPGERIYGFWPMSTHVVLHPDRISRHGFFDAAEHRRALPAVYNSYSRVAADPTYSEYDESRVALLRPLFLTAFALDRSIRDEQAHGAVQVVVSSASSKTALLTAFLLGREPGPELVGLTATRNRDFVAGSALYAQTMSYDEIGRVPLRPTLYVDFAGDVAVRDALRNHLGSNLVADVAVGITHWEAAGPTSRWAGPEPTFFFAPSHVMRMVESEGAAEFWQSYASAWDAFRPVGERLIRISERNGISALEEAYRGFATGSVDPAAGIVIRF